MKIDDAAVGRAAERAAPLPSIHIFRNSEALSLALAARLTDILGSNSAPVLGIATGSSPQPTYAALAKRREFRGLARDRLRVVALDEYIGLDSMHPQRYENVLRREFLNTFHIDRSRLLMPTVNDPDGHGAAKFESRLTQLGGVDVQILGIGENGHIGFNEPGSNPRSVTRIVELTSTTREANARFFSRNEQVPTHAITQGISTILRAHRIALIATGASKATAVMRTVMSRPTRDTPASFLQSHPKLELYLDLAAASRLDLDRLSAHTSVLMSRAG